ncbi:MAG: TIGR04086 family membrane protein [Clostridia bacterium]|nr:TIGR04086 family membrane protein [Clostridia bacterium]
MDIYQGTENKTIKNIAIGIGIAFITTFIFLLIFSAILTYSNISENMINPTIIVITAISILIGSSIVNMKIKKNGLINGGIIGGLYILTIYLISSLLNWKFALNTQSIIMIIVGIVFGILGGIIGVNQKR